MFIVSGLYCFFFFFKQKTAYEMRISDWSSDVCSSDLNLFRVGKELEERAHSRDFAAMLDISLDAKAAVGVFADFVDVPRAGLITASMQVDRAADNLGEVDGSLDVSTHQTKLL